MNMLLLNIDLDYLISIPNPIQSLLCDPAQRKEVLLVLNTPKNISKLVNLALSV